MTDARKYEESARTAGVNAVHRAMTTLREHWEWVEINVNSTDPQGNEARYSIESEGDDDDDEKED